jgi:hypothetical protein
MSQAQCHPEREKYSRGLCRPCYNKETDIKATSTKWRKSEKRKLWAKNYDKTEPRKSRHRKYRMGFSSTDELRFKVATDCDWCGQSFKGETPSIDHDHKCCAGGNTKRCGKCLRGFVHHRCNTMAIAYYEWMEREFGTTDSKLLEYRARFPVPRVEVCNEVGHAE